MRLDMFAALALALTALSPAACARQADTPVHAEHVGVLGDWAGVLEVPGQSLRLGLHVVETDDGLASTLDSPDQGAMGIAMTHTTYADGALTVSTPAMGLSMELSADGDALAGTFAQGGGVFDIRFERAEPTEEAALARPQTPQPPFPYTTRAAAIANPNADGVVLAGELFEPEGDGPFAAVVLLTGSGPQNRDEELFGHKPFLVLGDHLARHGVAVLRYDDRGVAYSTGDLTDATIADFASDAAAAAAWLRMQPNIDADHIGFIGHSEGAATGPMAAALVDTAFLVLVAGVAVPFEELLNEQGRLIAETAGASAEAIAADAAARAAVLTAARTAAPDDCRAQAIAALAGLEFTAQIAAAQADGACSAWMRHALSLDFIAPIAAFEGPVLALFGTKDLQVPPHQNAGPMRAALAVGGHPASRVIVLDGLNHLMQPADTGAVSEYGRIETTFDPAALAAITTFIKDVTQD